MFLKIKKTILSHKILTLIIIAALVGGGYYFFHSSSQSQAATKYVLATAKKDTLVASVSASGQVEATDQIDIKAKVSGEVLSVRVKKGQEVKAGTVLAIIDSGDAQKAVRDAQASLDSAQLAWQKLLAPVDQLSVMQAEDAVTQAQKTKQDAQNNLMAMADDEFTAVSNVFLDLPNIMAGLQNILLSQSINSSQYNIDYYADIAKLYDENALQYRSNSYDSYNKARAAYDKNFADYKAASRYSDSAAIDGLLNETYNTIKNISDAIKNANNLVQFYQDILTRYTSQNPVATSNTHLTNLNSYTGKTNTHLSNLSSFRSKAENYRQTIADSDRIITEKNLSLQKVTAGPDESDLASQKLTVRQRQEALADAKTKLADYSIIAPIDGILSDVMIAKGDTIGSASVATLITKQQIAKVILNEVDTAKVKISHKAMLIFDAVEGLTISGQVVQIDVLGTVSQGVVNYNVEIAFDAQDDRVKPGMSVQASIITEAKPDVVVVPSSAVKTQNGQSYIQLADQPPATGNTAAGISSQIILKNQPVRQAVEVGLSNGSMTEIISGLKEGDTVVSQTISGTATSNNSFSQRSSNSLIPEMGGGSGGATRAIYNAGR